jgi:hypothetical protein
MPYFSMLLNAVDPVGPVYKLLLYKLQQAPPFPPVSFPPPYRGGGNRGKDRHSRFGAFRESRDIN